MLHKTVYSDRKVANRFREMAHEAVSRRRPIPLSRIVARTPTGTRTPREFGICPSFKDHSMLLRGNLEKYGRKDTHNTHIVTGRSPGLPVKAVELGGASAGLAACRCRRSACSWASSGFSGVASAARATSGGTTPNGSSPSSAPWAQLPYQIEPQPFTRLSRPMITSWCS
jgi:hypothetical protein